MQAHIEWIDENDAAAGEQTGHQFSEGGAVGFASCVGFAEGLRDLVGEGALESLRRGNYDPFDLVTESEFLRRGGQRLQV